jgi:hypothetical protein
MSTIGVISDLAQCNVKFAHSVGRWF